MFVIFVLLACGYFGWVAEGFVTSGLLASSGLPSKFFPQLTLGLTGVCAVVIGYLYYTQGAASEDEDTYVFQNTAEARQGILVLIAVVISYLVWRQFGFIAMAILLGPLSLIGMGIKNPVIYAVVLALTGFIAVVFIYGLGVQLV